MKFTKLKKIILVPFFLFPVVAVGQGVDIVNLDPEIVAASNCSGAISGGAIGNYSLGVLNEERTRDVVYSSTLYQLAVMLNNADKNHFQRYGEEYDKFASMSVQQVIDASDRGEFDWDLQAEIDVCTARMLKVLTSPLPEELQQNSFREELRNEVDARFSAMLRLLEAMQ